MPSAEEIAKLGRKSGSGGRLPIEPLTVEPLPPEIVRAFPTLREWEKQTNRRIATWIERLNTVLPTDTT